MSATKDLISVSLLPTSPSLGLAPHSAKSAQAAVKSEGVKPAHWKDARGTAFLNPWPSYKDLSFSDFLSLIGRKFPSVPPDVEEQIGFVRPTWGAPLPSPSPLPAPSNEEEAKKTTENSGEEKIKVTWLGHACLLVELPVRASPALGYRPARGARILFDPVFSDRCSPTQWIGPKRFTRQLCEVEEIPDIDAIVISHNHYDHLDVDTIKRLFKRPHPPHIFAPLGNTDLFQSIGIPKGKIHCLDWWEGRRVEVQVQNIDSDVENVVIFEMICTPAQHQSNRGLFDRYKSLWGGWVVREVLPPSSYSSSSSSEPHLSPPSAFASEANTLSGTGGGELDKNSSLEREVKVQVQEQGGRDTGREGVKVYFAGDTGYRYVPEGADEEKVPFCPAFKEIGERFGGFDFAMIPIGAYEPREFMSRFHVAPQDSVRIFRDVRAKKALGMHWGTWILTSEEVTDPPRRLAEECRKAGIPEGAFGVCKLGETRFY